MLAAYTAGRFDASLAIVAESATHEQRAPFAVPRCGELVVPRCGRSVLRNGARYVECAAAASKREGAAARRVAQADVVAWRRVFRTNRHDTPPRHSRCKTLRAAYAAGVLAACLHALRSRLLDLVLDSRITTAKADEIDEVVARIEVSIGHGLADPLPSICPATQEGVDAVFALLDRAATLAREPRFLGCAERRALRGTLLTACDRRV